MPEHMSEPVPHLLPEDEAIIRTYLRHAMPFFIEGGPGIGKSLAANYLGRAVYRAELCPAAEHGPAGPGCICDPIKVDITEDTEVRHLLGEVDFVRYFLDARAGARDAGLRDFFRKGPMVQAMEQGRLLIVEELDRAGRETLFPILFDAIERKRTYVPELGAADGDRAEGAEILARPHFNIVITVNRFTDVGTVRLPEALLRRLRRVSLFDPSRVASDGLDQPESPARQAFNFEMQLALNNLEADGVPRRELDGTPLGRRLNDLLGLIYALRQDGARSPDAAVADEHVTPAEAARFIRDLFICERAALEGSDPSGLLDALRRHVGALAKDDAHARAVHSFLSMAYIEKRPPFPASAP